ncbi:hypothetical protein J3998_11985 [Thiomicrorhabdus sp. 6S2-11]|uniref:Uncharacterized protein n=1 Tax=Thiomicrorhabdus marina TaxID=2818442 RepID=A0ABS3Q839_9GAMM|nr:hypothetical protein [Thiomicrorhabdus marina]MBO1928293.1 hypothetical protein [Thiomicrorhabdus marina]
MPAKKPFYATLNSKKTILNFSDVDNILGYGEFGNVLIGHSFNSLISNDSTLVYEKTINKIIANGEKNGKFLSFQVFNSDGLRILIDFYIQLSNLGEQNYISVIGFEHQEREINQLSLSKSKMLLNSIKKMDLI